MLGNFLGLMIKWEDCFWIDPVFNQQIRQSDKVEFKLFGKGISVK